MATEVGTLLISMQADLARLRKDMSEAKGITGRAMDDITRSIDGVKNAFGLLGVGVSAGGLVMVAKQAVDAADDMAKLSQRTGIATKELAQWKLVADLSGASVESLGKGVKGLATYAKEHGDRMRALGIDTQDANVAMLQLADIVAALPDGLEKSALMSELLGGKIGAELIPVFNLGSKGIAELKAKADDYAERLARLAPHAEAFNDALTELGLQSQAASINIGQALIPGLAGLVQWFNDAAAGGDRLKQAIDFLKASDSSILRQWGGMADAGQRARQLLGIDKPVSGWELAGMDPTTGRTLGAGGAAAASPWGTDAAFLARMQANVLLGPRGGTAARAPREAVSEAERRLQQMLREQAQREAELVALSGDEQTVSVDTVSRQLATRDGAALDKLRRQYVDLADPLQHYRDQLDEINRLRAANKIDAAVALNAEWAVGEAMDEAAQKMMGLKEAGKDTFSELGRVIDGWGKSSAEAFADWAMGAEMSIGAVGKRMLRELLVMQSYERIFKPFYGQVGKLLDSGLTALTGSAQGNVFAAHGLAAYENQIITRPTLFPFARGIGLVGEEPGAPGEAIMPLQRMSGGDLGVKVAVPGAARPPDVTVQIVNQTGQPVSARPQGPPRQDGARWVLSVVMDAASADPNFRAALRG